MLNKSTILTYPFLIILSIGKKSFANMGRFMQMGLENAFQKTLTFSIIMLPQSCLHMHSSKLNTPEEALRRVREEFSHGRFYDFVDQFDFSPSYDA